jgi:hypothetical protein
MSAAMCPIEHPSLGDSGTLTLPGQMPRRDSQSRERRRENSAEIGVRAGSRRKAAGGAAAGGRSAGGAEPVGSARPLQKVVRRAMNFGSGHRVITLLLVWQSM